MLAAYIYPTLLTLYCSILATSLAYGEHCRLKVPLKERLECGYRGITEDQCIQRGCCFDKSQMIISVLKCYFPGECEQLVQITGSGSALLALTGREQDVGLPPSNAYGGAWCTRSIPHIQAHMHFEISLHTIRDVYMVSETDLALQMSQLQVTYADEHFMWQTLDNPAYLPKTSTFTSETDATFLGLTLWKLKISMRDTGNGNRSCISLNFVSCPSDYVPTTAATTEMTTRATSIRTQITLTEEPSTAPLVESDVTDADKRPSAVALGMLGVILVICELVFFILMDIPAFKDNIILLRHNLSPCTGKNNRRKLKGEGMNGKVIFQRIQSPPKTQDDLLADTHVCLAHAPGALPTKTQTVHVNEISLPNKYSRLPYIDQDVVVV